MEKTLLNIETIAEYNDRLGVETLHPLVSVIDLAKARPMRHMRHTFSFYVVFLKDEKNCDLIYGRQRYDYQKGSVVCLAPGQVIGIEDTGEEFQPQGYALCFHPDLIRGTHLGRHIGEYTFFSYEVNEALENAKEQAFKLGVSRGVDPFMTLSFMALTVIPTLRLTTRGVFDVINQRYV